MGCLANKSKAWRQISSRDRSPFSTVAPQMVSYKRLNLSAAAAPPTATTAANAHLERSKRITAKATAVGTQPENHQVWRTAAFNAQATAFRPSTTRRNRGRSRLNSAWPQDSATTHIVNRPPVSSHAK